MTLDLKACAFDCTAAADDPYSLEGRDPLQFSARLAGLNGSSDGNTTFRAAKQIGQPTTAHSHSLAIQEHSAPSFMEAVLSTTDLVSVIPFSSLKLQSKRRSVQHPRQLYQG